MSEIRDDIYGALFAISGGHLDLFLTGRQAPQDWEVNGVPPQPPTQKNDDPEEEAA
jgi:hypothetical protein